MQAPKCLARLTSWEKTKCRIGNSNTTASIIKVCRGKPEEGEVLCKGCLERPVGGKYQTRMMHGLLTDPIPYESHIYGSPWYWEKVAKYGDPEDEEWLLQAEVAQMEIEAVVEDAWKVQRPEEEELEDMVQETNKKNKKQAINRLRGIKKEEAKPLPKAATLLNKFPPIKILYEESEKPPKKMPTDSMSIKKEKWEDQEVWVTETGLVFDVDPTGDIGEYLGIVKEDEFISAEEEK